MFKGRKKPMKKRTFLILAVLILNLALQDLVLAAENEISQNKYPDYSYEFVGQDKFENFNRKVFIFNIQFNRYIMRPLTIVWESVVPKSGMEKIKNFYTNVKYPIRLTSCLLQKDFHASKIETMRFLTNSTVGILGINDPATTKYHLESYQEDLGQAMSFHKIKSGPYIVLPTKNPTTIVDFIGDTVGSNLTLTSGLSGITSQISSNVSQINTSAYTQPIVKMIDSYADPYTFSKEMFGLERYIKLSNLDRKEVLKEKQASVKKIEPFPEQTVSNLKSNINSDILLNDFNPQSPTIDAIRTIKFDNQSIDEDSKWAGLSAWNKNFSKQIKSSSIRITAKHPKYQYRYILQENKNAPLAIIYPSFGEGVMSNESLIQAKILYDSGYCVLIMGSPFQWQFVKSMYDNYRPGNLYYDASCMRRATALAISNIQGKNYYFFKKRIIVGTSFGALSALFTAAEENQKNILNVSNYIAINPPIELFYALNQLDDFSKELNDSQDNVKLKIAVTAQKYLSVSALNEENLPFTDTEAKMAISFALRQKLSDVVFTIEHGYASKKNPRIYSEINNLSFYDYVQKYLMTDKNYTIEQLSYDSSLYSIAKFLKTNNNYKIYHSIDDFFTTPQQLNWLKKQTGNKSLFFSNGSHLGYMYRQEFLNEFKKDIEIKN